jgi:hypothetical protein
MEWEPIKIASVKANFHPADRSHFVVTAALAATPPEGWVLSLPPGKFISAPIEFDGQAVFFVALKKDIEAVLGVVREMVDLGNTNYRNKVLPIIQAQAEQDARDKTELDALNEQLGKL